LLKIKDKTLYELERHGRRALHKKPREWIILTRLISISCRIASPYKKINIEQGIFFDYIFTK